MRPVTWRAHPIVSLLALAATSLPVTAQSGSEAVVCVGSERRTLATNPIRRVYTEDMEIVYRIGVDIGQRDQIERDLGSDLSAYPEVWCAWSDPGDDQAVIISYPGVIHRDLTVDPEDPRFQAFSVGFATDFDATETQATTIDRHFTRAVTTAQAPDAPAVLTKKISQSRAKPRTTNQQRNVHENDRQAPSVPYLCGAFCDHTSLAINLRGSDRHL